MSCSAPGVLQRFKPLLAVGLSLALALLCLDTLLGTVFGESLGWAAPAMDSDLLDDWGRRIARVERMQTDGELNPAYVVAVLGMSSVREDLDSAVLGMHDPKHRSWLILGASGGNLTQLQQYSFTLTSSRLSPSVVVLGIHKSMLQDEEQVVRHADPHKVAASLLRGRVISAIREAQLLTWFGRHNDALSNWAVMGVHHARLALNRHQLLQMDAIYRPLDNPWWVNSSYGGIRASADDLASQAEGLRSGLRPERYSPLNPQVRALADLVHRFRQRGSRVVCLLMPESSDYRSLYSPHIDAMFDQALSLSAQGQGIPVVDLRDTVEDSLFYDHAHLNPAGRRLLSELLPNKINQ